MINNKNNILTIEELEEFAKSSSIAERYLAVLHKYNLDHLIKDSSPWIREAVAIHGTVSHRDTLVNDESDIVRTAVARNGNDCQRTVLIGDESVNVRRNVARFGNSNHVSLLLEDNSERVRASAEERFQELASTQQMKEYYVVEFNETSSEMNIPSFEGKPVTSSLLEKFEFINKMCQAKDCGYYKFYIDHVKDGQVIEHGRVDIGDLSDSFAPFKTEMTGYLSNIRTSVLKEIAQDNSSLNEYIQSIPEGKNIFSGNKELLEGNAFSAYAKYEKESEEYHSMTCSRLCCKEDLECQQSKVQAAYDDFKKELLGQIYSSPMINADFSFDIAGRKINLSSAIVEDMATGKKMNINLPSNIDLKSSDKEQLKNLFLGKDASLLSKNGNTLNCRLCAVPGGFNIKTFSPVIDKSNELSMR